MRKKYKRYNKKQHNRYEYIFITFLLLAMAFYFESICLFAFGIMMLLPVAIGRIKKRRQKKKYLNSNLYYIDRMQGDEFEKYLKAHFEKKGYRVQLTPGTNDYGIDLICKKKIISNKDTPENFVVQAKRYNKSVGIAAVQQVIGGMNYYSCEKGIVITNNYFTKNAKELATRSRVALWDRDKLRKEFDIRGTGKAAWQKRKVHKGNT